MNRRAIRVLLAFLNTGGGHRSTAHAVAAALQDCYGSRVAVDLVDVTRYYFPWPLSQLGAIYNGLVRLGGWPWALTYYLTDGRRRIALLKHAWWLLTRKSILTLITDHPADVVVCCHPLLKAPCVQALAARTADTPLITLVTDLASGHASWFVRGGARCLVATEEVRSLARARGLPAESIEITGLPVHPDFVNAARQDPVTTRERLGLSTDRPVVLLLSGADGVGPLPHLVEALVDSGAKAQLAVITGHDEQTRHELVSRPWSLPVRVVGFVNNIHEWMLAADVLVTKAGPSTISEALVMSLPIVLSGAVPGQEEPNVDYVVNRGAGVWAPTPREVAGAVRVLLDDGNASLIQMSECARVAARPGAAHRVARIIWEAGTTTQQRLA